MGMAWHQRLLLIAVGVSCAGHLAVIGTQLLLVWVGWLAPQSRQAKLIYDRPEVRSTSSWTPKETVQPQARFKELVRSMTVTVPSSVGRGMLGGGGRERDAVLGMSKPESYSQVMEHLDRGWGGAGGGVWATAVDLTNVAEAAQGNPVLLSYFEAIREQIQRTANTQTWMPPGDASAGVVYVGFVLTSAGHVQSASVVQERSTASSELVQVALRIVKASSPFLPFPPSFKEPSKAIVVPLEFSFDAS